MAYTENLGFAAALVQLTGSGPTSAERVREPGINRFHFEHIDQPKLQQMFQQYTNSSLSVDPFAFIKDIHMLKKMEPSK